MDRYDREIRLLDCVIIGGEVAFAAILFVASFARGADPVFVVTNRVPVTFVVENRIPAPPPTVYHAIYARVLAGERVKVTVPAEGIEGMPPGFLAPGEWEVFLQNGRPVGVRKATPGVVVPSPKALPAVGISDAGSPTTAHVVGSSRARSAGIYRTGNTFTLTAGFPGATDCGESG